MRSCLFSAELFLSLILSLRALCRNYQTDELQIERKIR